MTTRELPFFTGALVAKFQGETKRVWAIEPERYREGPLYGVWGNQPETRQIENGEQVVRTETHCSGNLYPGSEYGVSTPQACVVLGQSFNRATFQNSGYRLVYPSRPIYGRSGIIGYTHDVWAREYPYQVTEPAYKTQYRYNGFILDISFPLAVGYPDIEQAVQSDWLDEPASRYDMSMIWSPVQLCDPKTEVTCGSIDTEWCCHDCREIRKDIVRVQGETEGINAEISQLSNLIKGLV